MSDEIDVALDAEQTIPEKREFVIDRPGFINYAEARGNYSGCFLRTFTGMSGNGVDNQSQSATEELNEFFRQRANLLVVGIWRSGSVIDVLYTNTLEGEELEEFNEYSRSISIHMAEWRKERAERKAKREQKEVDAQAEIKRKLQQAEHCEKNHGALERKAKKK